MICGLKLLRRVGIGRRQLTDGVVCLEVLADEPALQFVAAHHFTDDEIVRTVIAPLGRFACEGAGFLQHDLVSVEETPQLVRGALAPSGCARNTRFLSSANAPSCRGRVTPSCARGGD